MYAIPPDVTPDGGERHTGLTCPDCQGAISVRGEGDNNRLVFKCRVGHAYGVQEMLEGKEEHLEKVLWTAVHAFEEMGVLLTDLHRHYRDQPGTPAADYEARIAIART